MIPAPKLVPRAIGFRPPGRAALEPGSRRPDARSARRRGAHELAVAVNKEYGILLHYIMVQHVSSRICNSLPSSTSHVIHAGVNILAFATSLGTPTLGPGCKGGGRDWTGCAHHLNLKECAHVHP